MKSRRSLLIDFDGNFNGDNYKNLNDEVKDLFKSEQVKTILKLLKILKICKKVLIDYI